MSTALAIVYAIISYTLLDIGFVLQKKGVDELPAIETQNATDNAKNFLKSKTWVAGFLLTNVQIIFYWLALNEGSLSLVVPMMGFGLVVFVIFSVILLEEKLTKKEIGGIVLTITGIVILGLTTPETEEQISYDEMVRILLQIESIIFLLGCLVAAIVFVMLSVSRDYKNADVLFGLSAGILTIFGAVGSKAFMTPIDPGNPATIWLALSLLGWWIFLIMLIGGSFCSMVSQQIGFQKGKAVLVVALFNVLNILLPSLFGILIFDEWAELDPNLVNWKILSFILLLAGVLILSIFGTSLPIAPIEESGKEIEKSEK